MNTLKVAAVTLNQTPMDFEQNLLNIQSALVHGYRDQIELMVFPEMCISGYGCNDAFFSTYVLNQSKEYLKKLIIFLSTGPIFPVFVIGLPIEVNGALYNCAVVINNNKIEGIVPKQHMAGDGLHYDPRWFKPWPSGITAYIKLFDDLTNHNHPSLIGDIMFDFNKFKLGVEICESMWVSNRPLQNLSKHAVDVVVNPSASHFSIGKHETRKQIVKDSSREGACTYIYSNLVGNEEGRIIYDGGAIIANNGNIVAEGDRFEYTAVSITEAVIDLDVSRTTRRKLHSFVPSYSTPFDDAVLSNICIKNVKDTKESLRYIKTQLTPYQEFENAVGLGLFDYLRKSKTNGFTISLSGGMDSTAVAMLCRFAFKQAFDSIGIIGIKNRLSHIDLKHCDSVDSLCSSLIHVIYQGSDNSGDKTLMSAKAVSGDLGIHFNYSGISDIVSLYTKKLQEYFDRSLEWDTDGISLQNIQARTRGPMAWGIANITNSLLLTTGNRSEQTVGYSTMDGDTCGSLAPIGGVSKTFLIGWVSDHAHRMGYRRIIYNTLNLAPTAELKPIDQNQTDEDDLMPYPILEKFERLVAKHSKSPLEIYQIMHTKNKENNIILRERIIKFFRLWIRSQWKREQSAPSFHLDDLSMDARSWFRYPLLCGGFEDELKQLENYMEI